VKCSFVITSFVIAVAAAFAHVAAAAETAVPGTVVVARASSDALLVWDSTPEIASIVKEKLSDRDANARIEHDALHVLAESLDKVGKEAKTITVRVIYSRTGDVSPVYGTPTFLGIEKYATVAATRADLVSDRDKWKELGDTVELPAWFKVEILGKLPPR
jgi:hypothetical protein